MKSKGICSMLIIGLLFLCSCGAQDNEAEQLLDPQSPITITLWHYYVGENKIALEQAVSEFNHSVGMETGVIVETVGKGSIAELEEDVTNSAMGVITAGPMPDIFSSYPDKAMELDALGKVCDLREYFSEEELSLYVDDFLADGIFSEERLLLLPVVKSTEVLYLNATAWEEFLAENPAFDLAQLESWQSLYTVSRAFYQWTDAKTPGIPWDGQSFMGIDTVPNYVIIGSKQHDVNVIDSMKEQALLDRSALQDLFAIYYQAYSLDYFDAIARTRSDDIKSGEIIAYVGSTSGAAYFPIWTEKDNQKIDIDLLPQSFPTFDGGKPYAIQQGAGMCVAKSTAERAAGAALFLKWFTGGEQNAEFAMTTGYLPVQEAAYSSSTLADALARMMEGEKAQVNLAEVYGIALKQITEANTYAAHPFDGSYTVRTILGNTLLEAGEAGRQLADSLKARGQSEEEILRALDVDAAFDAWIASMKAQLQEREIPYTDME